MLITRDTTKQSEDRTNLALTKKFRIKYNQLNDIKDATLRALLQMQSVANEIGDRVSVLHDDLERDCDENEAALRAKGITGKDDVIAEVRRLLNEAEEELDEINKGIDTSITCLNLCQQCVGGGQGTQNICTTNEGGTSGCTTEGSICLVEGNTCDSETQATLDCIYSGNNLCTDENQGTGIVINTCPECHGSEVTTTICTPTTNGSTSCNVPDGPTQCDSTVDSQDLCNSDNPSSSKCSFFNTSGDCIRNNNSGNCSIENFQGECTTNNGSYECISDNDTGDCYINNQSGSCSSRNQSGNCEKSNTSGNCIMSNTSGNCSFTNSSGNCNLGNDAGNCITNNDAGEEIDTCVMWNGGLCLTAVNTTDSICRISNAAGNCRRTNSTGDCVAENSSGSCYLLNTRGDCLVSNDSGNCVQNNNSGDCTNNDASHNCDSNNPPGTNCDYNNTSGNCSSGNSTGVCADDNSPGTDCTAGNKYGNCTLANANGDCNVSNSTGECTTQGCSGCQECLTCLTGQTTWNCDNCISGLSECTGGASLDPTTWEEIVPTGCTDAVVAGQQTLQNCREVGDAYDEAVNACNPSFSSCSNLASCDYTRFGTVMGCDTTQGCGICNTNNTCTGGQTCTTGQTCYTCNVTSNCGTCQSTTQCSSCNSGCNSSCLTCNYGCEATAQQCTSAAETCVGCFGQTTWCQWKVGCQQEQE